MMAEFGETPDWIRPVCVMTLKEVTGVCAIRGGRKWGGQKSLKVFISV